MLRITPELEIPEAELQERFVRAPGPGGQNVNKIASAVMLRFDAARSTVLSEAARARLAVLAGRRLTDQGVIVIIASRYRTQARNRADARHRLAALIARATEAPPPPRRATRPSKASITRRLDSKSQRGQRKALRRPPGKD